MPARTSTARESPALGTITLTSSGALPCRKNLETCSGHNIGLQSATRIKNKNKNTKSRYKYNIKYITIANPVALALARGGDGRQETMCVGERNATRVCVCGRQEPVG